MHFCPNCGNMLLLECVPKDSRGYGWHPTGGKTRTTTVARGKAAAAGARVKEEGGDGGSASPSGRVDDPAGKAGAKRRKKNSTASAASASKEEHSAMFNAQQDMEAASADVYNTPVGGGQMRMYCRTCPYYWNIQHGIRDTLPEGNGSGAYNEAAAIGLDGPTGSGDRLQSSANRQAESLNDVMGGAASWENVARTSGVVCSKCGHNEAFFHQVQTRSADEPMTEFYKCVNCGHKWKE